MTFGDHPEPKEPVPDTQDALIEPSQASLLGKLGGAKWHKYTRFIMAALGSIPWVGGLIAATASFSAEKEQEKISDLQKLWLEEHQEKVRELGRTLNDIFGRLKNLGPEIEERIESPEYLALVKKNFSFMG